MHDVSPPLIHPSQSLVALALRLLAVMVAAVLAGCQSGSDYTPVRTTYEPTVIEEPDTGPADLWERMRQGFQLQEYADLNPRIEQQRLWLTSNTTYIQQALQRGTPYLFYIVDQLDKRNMPLELALMPVIESQFNPFATGGEHVGLWQFGPTTARNFNLRLTQSYDGRKDITASTRAAIDYLDYLHNLLNGDWLLAVAAYNSGEGTVSKAIARNRKLGLPTDYWNLTLPDVTRDYIPRLLALSQIILVPDSYGMALEPVANEPYFQIVELEHRVDLSQVAKLVDLETDELRKLNPALTQKITRDVPKRILVPAEKAEQLSSSVDQLPPAKIVENPAPQKSRTRASSSAHGKSRYKVVAGDNLWIIAKKTGVSLKTLKRLNPSADTKLKPGNTLRLTR